MALARAPRIACVQAFGAIALPGVKARLLFQGTFHNSAATAKLFIIKEGNASCKTQRITTQSLH
ncbi:hypothetical protein EH31_10775 [Erythrobacter longus]|uniref:Uncharacterized protein n=1 Tax=Erythrobacter longus TaxID=1044 RepID=A0A074MY77_ERYLO|nr:hypothetical protein EH31_10775 [Erythrobacter longus]